MEKEALLYEKLDSLAVRCFLCAHRCYIAEGGFGFCSVRQNSKGILYALNYSRPVAVHVDPIEKKPLYHFFPGSKSFSLAAAGCNFRCGFCQNWQISQISHQEFSSQAIGFPPPELVNTALKQQCRSIAYTYTEPTIFFEYALDTARLAKEKGLSNVLVTNGYMSKEALAVIAPYIDAANIDLKSFREQFYKSHCKARLSPVLETIKAMKAAGIWIEITTLVIPGENDSEQELKDTADFIATVGKGIPWHISRFHPDYTFKNYQHTPPSILEKAYACGKAAGLFYVYLGNTGRNNDTYCRHCGQRLIQRASFSIVDNQIDNGLCRFCSHPLDGVF